MILHFFLSLLDSPLKELLFRLEAILDIGILGVNCILYPILLGFWEAVKILPIDVVSPGWAFTNLINFRVFHLPKANQLPDLLQDRTDSGDQFTNPSSAGQRHLFGEDLKLLIIPLQIEINTRSVISYGQNLRFFIKIDILLLPEILQN